LSIKDSKKGYSTNLSTIRSLKIGTLNGGRNSEVFLIENLGEWLVAKVFRRGKLLRERFDREVAFLRFAASHGIPNTPLIKHLDEFELFILETYMAGYKTLQLSTSDIESAARFITSLNAHESSVASYPFKAIDYYGERMNIVNDIYRRIEILKQVESEKILTLQRPSRKIFLRHCFAWLQRNELHVLEDVNVFSSNLRFKTILSPSDFTFSNTVRQGKELCFFDFEYSGIDHPLKLIGDFIVQPDHIIDEKFQACFLINLDWLFKSDIRKLPEVIELSFILKWSLIMLSSLEKSGEEPHHIDGQINSYLKRFGLGSMEKPTLGSII